MHQYVKYLAQKWWQNGANTFTEERVITNCFFNAHDTTPVPKWNVYPDVFFLPYVLPPFSPLVYPMSLNFYEINTLCQGPLCHLHTSKFFYLLPNESLFVTPWILRSDLLHTWCLVLLLLNTFKASINPFKQRRI